MLLVFGRSGQFALVHSDTAFTRFPLLTPVLMTLAIFSISSHVAFLPFNSLFPSVVVSSVMYRFLQIGARVPNQ